MIAAVLTDDKFPEILERFDADRVAECSAERCPHCQGRLDRSDYPRKPRGAFGQPGTGYVLRPSLCCSVDGCRRRLTPPSVRFLGRKVYLGVTVVLAAAMLQGPTPWRVRRLSRELGVGRRTLLRWRRWWTEDFGRGTPLKRIGGLFAEPVAAGELPLSLLGALGWPGQQEEAMLGVLKLLSAVCGSSGTAGQGL